ncbi:phage major capsid protein, HK97 family [Wolbachia endosymbiont of Trichogramma pretiosum]|nr:phage major capsid protein, HK97 family [Wolbachia endosymbiont of Trichogramma pretiosum]
MLLKSETGQYLWQPSLSLETPDTLMVIPVYQSADMPPTMIAVRILNKLIRS